MDATRARVLGFPAFLHAGPLYRLARVFLLSNTWPLVLLLVALAAHLARSTLATHSHGHHRAHAYPVTRAQNRHNVA